MTCIYVRPNNTFLSITIHHIHSENVFMAFIFNLILFLNLMLFSVLVPNCHIVNQEKNVVIRKLIFCFVGLNWINSSNYLYYCNGFCVYFEYFVAAIFLNYFFCDFYALYNKLHGLYLGKYIMLSINYILKMYLSY